MTTRGAVEITGRLLQSRQVVRVSVEAGRIVDLTPVDGNCDELIVPGLIDLQINGFAGHDVNADDVRSDDIAALVTSQWRLGVAGLCPTVVTGPQERMLGALRAIRQARARDPLLAHAVPCVHVEGPHISSVDGPRGAHDQRHVRPPSVEEFNQWQDASGNLVGVVTVAPELPGALDYIRHLSNLGIVTAIGHTAAEPADINNAVDAGARLATHLGNGAHAHIQRHPNYIWEQLAHDRLSASFIADGHHLPASVLTAMLRAKGIERSILVSDAVALAALPPGRYDTPVGGQVELSADGRLSLAGTALLAGAARSLPECVLWASRHAGVTLRDAIRMASTNPAHMLGLHAPLPRGEVRVGASADLTVFRPSPDAAHTLAATATLVAGVVVHEADTDAVRVRP